MPKAKVVKMPTTVQRIVRKKYTIPTKVNIEKPVAKIANALPQTNKALKSKTREPDPVITMIQNVIDEAFPGRNKIAYVNAAVEATVCYTTIRRLMEGQTTRPWHSTVKAIFTACGYDYLVQKRSLDTQVG